MWEFNACDSLRVKLHQLYLFAWFYIPKSNSAIRFTPSHHILRVRCEPSLHVHYSQVVETRSEFVQLKLFLKFRKKYFFAFEGIYEVDLIISWAEQNIVSIKWKLEELNLRNILHVENAKWFLKCDQLNHLKYLHYRSCLRWISEFVIRVSFDSLKTDVPSLGHLKS
jgi:hypothetical protein